MGYGFVSRQNVRSTVRGSELQPASIVYLGGVSADPSANAAILITPEGVIYAAEADIGQPGVVQPDGTSILVTSGVISANISVASSSIAGTVRPDGTSILVTSGVISVGQAPISTATTTSVGISRPDGTSIVISTGILRLGTSLSLTTRTTQTGSQNATMITSTAGLGGLEIQSAGASGAAFMAFHRPSAHASYFGIDTDNQFAVAGWSAGGALTSFKAGSLGVGTAASGTAGEIRATNNVTAYYSDARLKDFKGTIPNALAKVQALNGYYFTENALAKELGYNNDHQQVGVSAQEVEAVLPEVVTAAPISAEYKTVYYDKLVPLLIEAIKELSDKVNKLEGK